jgi:hypothetical protein
MAYYRLHSLDNICDGAAEPGPDGGVQGWVDSTATPTRYGLSLRSFVARSLSPLTRPGWSPASRWTWVAFGVLDATHECHTIIAMYNGLQPKGPSTLSISKDSSLASSEHLRKRMTQHNICIANTNKNGTM